MSDYSPATHRITVHKWGKRCVIRKKKFNYVLRDNGEVCGNRLFKGNDDKHARGHWPFKSPDWMFHNVKTEAEEAAEKLQAYLDAREISKAKKK